MLWTMHCVPPRRRDSAACVGCRQPLSEDIAYRSGPIGPRGRRISAKESFRTAAKSALAFRTKASLDQFRSETSVCNERYDIFGTVTSHERALRSPTAAGSRRLWEEPFNLLR